MKTRFYYPMMLLVILFSSPSFSQNGQQGEAHYLQRPSGFIKDVHEMERSPFNIKKTGPPKPADAEMEGEKEEFEMLDFNRNKNLLERARANVFQFDEGKNVTLPAVPPPKSVVTTQDPAFTFTGNQQNGSIPSDAEGAAGPLYIVALSNGDARIINKLTGAVYSTVTLDAFFGGFSGSFDPRIFYDPFGKRFVAEALSGARNPCSPVDSKFRILVSSTSDPTQGWYYYEFDFDPNNSAWMDFGLIGFNKDWIVLNGNSICGSLNSLFAFPKAGVYAGGSITYYSWAGIGIFPPALTYDNSLDREYLVGIGNPNLNGVGYVDSKYISGNPPSLFGSNSYGVASPWQANITPWCNEGQSYPDCGKIPQQFGSSVTFGFVGTFGHSFYQNCVYRNGSLWFTHPVFLPASGTDNRTSTQWWQVNPSTGVVQQVGRIDDPTGTVCTFYPSIAVNSQNDAVVSYCIFSPNYYQSAAYNFRNASDPAGSVPHALFYASGGNINTSTRTGDYGETVVDPNDDMSIWAINQVSSASADYFETKVTLLPAYYGCYTDATFGNNNWSGNTKNEASGSITSQEMIQANSNVVYDAGSLIRLSPGFRANLGCKFHAYINGCGGTIGIGNNQKDNTVEKSAISQANKEEINTPALQVFPNPTTSEVTLVFTLKKDERNVFVHVIDKTGREVKQQKLNNLNKGKQSFVMNLADLSSGIYNINLLLNNERLSANVVLSK